MTIPHGYTDLAPGKIASVVTYLEMRERPQQPLTNPPQGLTFRKVEVPALDWYRTLYRAVGQDWLWFRRLGMSDEELGRAIHHPNVDIYALAQDGQGDKGLLELDRGSESEVEIAYFGLTTDLVGQGAGRYMMEQGLTAAWANNPRRVWVHTCTLDHPRALAFYIKAGFVPYKRAIEVADDPRLTGKVPKTAAPHIPRIEI